MTGSASGRQLDGPGYVYGITNPAWPGFTKVGSSSDTANRLRQYQTGSPFRDYVVSVNVHFDDRLAAERLLQSQLNGLRVGGTEWFQIHYDDLAIFLKSIKEKET